MDRTNIIALLEDKIKYKGLKLPSYIDFSIKNKVLFIKLGHHQSKKGEVFSCTANMQTDEAAFEGWSICLKHHLAKYIDTVIMSWEKPDQLSGSQLLHYNRFLYRAIRFSQMFDWFDIAIINKNDIEEFEINLTDLIINTPLNDASYPSDKSSKEKQIEYNHQNLYCIMEYFKLQYINHQLPVGVKRNNKNFFTGRASAIDIWGIDKQECLNIFELKYRNIKVGIITELLFYSEVMYDLYVSKRIAKPSKIKKIRHAEHLYGNESATIKSLKSFFLFDRLHPMVVGTTNLLNTNNFGLKFYNAQYKLKKDTFLIDKVYYKGAFQMEEELRQTFYRKKNAIKGNGYILNNEDNNLHESIRDESKLYFKDNEIDWWAFDGIKTKPTKHLVSSQIQCLNYLFALRQDKDSILKLAQLFDSEIDDVLPTIGDNYAGYIAFEFVYDNAKLLNENDKGARRGSFCTSVDALIIAVKKGKRILIPIEWKYTENYYNSINKALEKGKGNTRQSRYIQFIKSSKQLKPFSDLLNSVYFYEPFYEFMRQTLLIEQMTINNIADDFIHIVVAPSENKDLLSDNYSFTKDNLETTWRNCLCDQNKFIIIDSKRILQLIENISTYTKLAEYLKLRYN